MDVQSSSGRDFWITDPQPDPSAHHLPAFADGNDKPSFKDLLDTINPLQHIPIISTVYRELTGDVPGAVSRLAGGMLYGGPIGLALEMADSAVDDSTGNDIGGHMWAALFDDGKGPDTPSATKVAAATPEPASSPAPSPAPATDQIAAAPAPAEVAKQPLSSDTPTQPVTPQLLASASATPPPGLAQTVSVSSNPSGPNGFLPVPTRRSIAVNQPMPANAVITNTNQRSNVPAAGRIIANPYQTDTRGVAVTQTNAGPAPVQPAASLPVQPTPSNSWVAEAMSKALDKYQQMNKLSQPPQPATVLQN